VRDSSIAVDVNLGQRYVKSGVIYVIIVVINVFISSRGRVGGRAVWSSCDVDDKCRLVGEMANEIVVQMNQQAAQSHTIKNFSLEISAFLTVLQSDYVKNTSTLKD